MFECVLAQQAIATEALVRRGGILRVACAGRDLVLVEHGPVEWVFQFPEPSPCRSVRLEIVGEVSEVVLRYVSLENPPERPEVVVQSGYSARILPFSSYSAGPERTATFQFARCEIRGFELQAAVETTSNQSLIVAGYDGQRMVAFLECILPRIDVGERLLYVFPAPMMVDVVRVFYIDRLPAIRHHVVRLTG